MKILVCGANGFIGRHVSDALCVAGHTVIRGVRAARSSTDIAIDFNNDTNVEDWVSRLENIDVVINAVGILCEGKDARFVSVHRDAPAALFDACELADVKRVIQISALGGGSENEWRPYLRSKHEADSHLMNSMLDWLILRPSLVVGIDGASSRFFQSLASLPLIGLPGNGDQPLQPVHIDDLCEVVVRAIESDASNLILDVVGPRAMDYREMLAAYRTAMGLASPIWLPVPMGLVRFSAVLAAGFPQRFFSSDTVAMLERGSAADVRPLAAFLGRAPRGASAWFAGMAPGTLRAEAIAGWSLPMFRIVLALVWLVTGILSFGIYPMDDSLAMLHRVGLDGTAAPAMLYAAALLDCGLGIATLAAPGRNLWRLQIVLIIVYTAIISTFLPEYWLHPFGPILKNLPILALLLVLDGSAGPSTGRSRGVAV